MKLVVWVYELNGVDVEGIGYQNARGGGGLEWGELRKIEKGCII